MAVKTETIELTPEGLKDLRAALDHAPSALITEELMQQIYERDRTVTAARHRAAEMHDLVEEHVGACPTAETPWDSAQQTTARVFIDDALSSGRIDRDVHAEMLRFYSL